MKLSKIALSLVVVVGIAQIGGAWYTGKQVEARYGELVNLANKELKVLKAYGVNAEYKDVKIERGFFSSDINYNLVVKNYDGENYIFKGADTLHHGPFPLNRLIKGKLLPVMASDEGILYSPDSLKSVFKDGVVLTTNIDIDYNTNLNGSAKTNAAKSTDGNFEISEVEAEFDTDKNGIGDVNLALDSVAFFNGVNVKFAAKNMEYKFTSEKSEYPYLGLGDYVFNVEKFYVGDNKNKFAMNNLEMEGKGYLDKVSYSSNTKMKTDISMTKNEITQNFGEMKLNADFVGDAKMWNNAIEKMYDDPENSDYATKLFLEAISKGSSLKINDLSLKNKQGKSDIKLDLNVKPFDPDLIQSENDVINTLSQSLLDMKFSIPATHLMIEQSELLNGETKQDAKQLADIKIGNITSQAKESDFFVVDDKNIKMKLAIDNGKVKLNDREMSDREIGQMLMIATFMFMGAGF
ncbi:DUF945 family protein [Pasteurella atlantica]|uniref:YdgA family protein n=1 Tax=Pasteurellaceae TaxID=712 RepID=UPI00275626B7|nr:DUF945 family protein [Pasteurella atlantica]MDP8032710.1 DUF945 family protein [Pasteurella atlantica]MDP8034784.1 DUF945 family protein [Pasteurella atlantica]MDP8036734.1 DUF945 family protein [Pasteurella atlantica]MDP8046944.1 DUF945 family protein [Pasteurella atlantica]MDP8048897.1 DUF945 family protein [Pasteurella atlantica]